MAIATTQGEAHESNVQIPRSLRRAASARAGTAGRLLSEARRRWPLTLGVLTTLLGVIITILGWNGAANTTVLQYQIPYIISGGVLGVALIVLGGMYQVGYVLWSQQRRSTSELLTVLSALTQELQRGIPTVDGSARSSLHREVAIVSGGSRYHASSCRVVVGKQSIPRSVQAAETEGYQACQICIDSRERQERP